MHSFPVTELFPYFMDLCVADSTQCMTALYKDFAYEQLHTILSMTDTGKDDFITWWTGQVATEFNLDQAALLDVYNVDEPYEANSGSRTFFKYGASNGVYGTPTAFVNGVKLDSVPASIDEWLDVLNSVYKSQYKTAHRFDHLKN